jgi:hypothetical protein
MLNAMWLEQGMEEKPDYALNRDALHLLTKGLLKKSWAALVHKNQSYERYTPVVSGHFAPGDSHTSYDVRVNWSNVKLTFNYSF